MTVRVAGVLGAALTGLAVLVGCAAPTPIDLGTVAAVPVSASPAPPLISTYPLVTGEPQPTVAPVTAPAPVVAPPPAPVPVVQPPAPPTPEPIYYPPPVTTPEPVLPPVTIPEAPPIGRYADDLTGAVVDAQLVVDGYWATHWSEFFTGTYGPPTVVGLYDGSAADVPTCAGERLPRYNAAYCVPGDYLAWDVTLMGLRTQIGNSWPYLVVAHEWGHAIQARLAPTLNSLALELQADCLAGATLYGAAADGTLALGPEAATEIATALAAAADEVPWTDVRDHGNAAERTGAFDAGRTGGVRACLPV